MDTLLLVILAIIILLTVGIFKAVGGLLKAALFSLAAAFVILAVIGGFAAKSTLDFKTSFESGTGLLLVTGDDGRLNSGFIVRWQDGQANDTWKAVSVLSKADLGDMNLRFANEEYASLLGNNSWLMTVRESSIANSGKTGTDAERFMTKLRNEPLIILSEFRKGNAIIYPEGLALKAIRLLPESLLSKVGERLK